MFAISDRNTGSLGQKTAPRKSCSNLECRSPISAAFLLIFSPSSFFHPKKERRKGRKLKKEEKQKIQRERKYRCNQLNGYEFPIKRKQNRERQERGGGENSENLSEKNGYKSMKSQMEKSEKILRMKKYLRQVYGRYK